MKIQQMAFMLMAVVLFFILVGLFWLSVQSSNLKKQANQLEQQKSVILASMLGESAEFTCGSYCVDTDKLMVLKNRQAYKNFWPVSYIKVQKIGREAEINPIECSNLTYPDCNVYTIVNKNKESTGTAESFVALCRKEKLNDIMYTKCELGFFLVGYEVKT